MADTSATISGSLTALASKIGINGGKFRTITSIIDFLVSAVMLMVGDDPMTKINELRTIKKNFTSRTKTEDEIKNDLANMIDFLMEIEPETVEVHATIDGTYFKFDTTMYRPQFANCQVARRDGSVYWLVQRTDEIDAAILAAKKDRDRFTYHRDYRRSNESRPDNVIGGAAVYVRLASL